ncbi:hypothetical protein Bca4012_091067 [Brassica carinata]
MLFNAWNTEMKGHDLKQVLRGGVLVFDACLFFPFVHTRVWSRVFIMGGVGWALCGPRLRVLCCPAMGFGF